MGERERERETSGGREVNVVGVGGRLKELVLFITSYTFFFFTKQKKNAKRVQKKMYPFANCCLKTWL